MTPHGKSIGLGVASIVAASIGWSVIYLILKNVSTELGPFTITFLEAVSGTIMTSLIYQISPRAGLRAIKKGGWPVMLMAFLGVTVANSIFVLALRHIDLGVGSILEKTQPIFTIILAALFLKERLSFLSICFGLLGLIGSIEVVPLAEAAASSFPMLTMETALGVVACLGAALSWAGAGVLGRKLAVDALGPVNMAFLRASIGAATSLPHCLLFEWLHAPVTIPWTAVGLTCLGGALDSVVCYVLYYHGMKYVAAGVTSIIEIITPVGAVLLGVVVLGETFALHQYIGAFIVLVSVTALVGNEIRMHAKSIPSLEKHS